METMQDYIDATAAESQSSKEKEEELTALCGWLTKKIGLFAATAAVCMLSDEWSEEQGVFGQQHGVQTIYYKDWHISYYKSGKFKIENLGVDSEEEMFYSYLIDGLKMLGL